MRFAADFRAIARDALSGKWLISALTAFVASLIGASLTSSGGGANVRINNSNGSFNEFFSQEVWNYIRMFLVIFVTYSAIATLVSLLIGGAGKLGYAKYNLNLVDGREARFSDLFSQFDRILEGFLMNLLLSLYIFLWSLLFVIPGLIKSYSYAMTPYILSEHPEYGPNDAITASREIMNGNKFRLFCLHLSFIGWSLLCSVPSVIAAIGLVTGGYYLLPLVLVTIVGNLFLSAYMEAAQAVFYREVSGTEGKGIHATFEEIQ